MEIKFKITEEDYINFNLYHIENSPAQKKTYNLLRYAMPILFSVPVYAVGAVLFKQPGGYWAAIALLFVAGWIVLWPNQYKKLIKRETQKILQEGDNSAIFGTKNMLIEEDSIKIISEFTSEEIAKESIKEIKIYEDMILIYLSSVTAQIIPTMDLDDQTKKHLLENLEIA